MIGLFFKGKHSYKDMGLFMRSDNRTVLPEFRKYELEIPGKHGSWDYGGNTFAKRIITVTFSVVKNSFADLRQQIRKIAIWLAGEGKLIFDDEPQVYYEAKVYDPIDLTQIQTSGEFSVSFECQPLAKSVFDVLDEILLDNDIPLDSDVYLDSPDMYIFDITQSTTINIDNFGTMPTKPRLTLVGSFSDFYITIGDKTISYLTEEDNATIIIDCEKMTITKNGENAISKCSGDLDTFFELQPGENEITIGRTVGIDAILKIDFTALYL